MIDNAEASSEESQLLGLDFRVHLPSNYSQDSEMKYPVLFIVHGRAGNSSLPWIFANLAKDLNAIIISPQADIPDPIGGYSWWLVDSKPGEESLSLSDSSNAEILHASEKLASFIIKSFSYYRIDTDMVLALGFSQGAAVLSSVVLEKKVKFRGLAMLASFVPKFYLEENFSNSFESISVLIAHGTKDPVVPLEWAEKSFDLFNQINGVKAEIVLDDVTHKVGSKGMKKIKDWFLSFTL